MTASTDGIGLGIAESLASHGAKVMISSRKEANVSAAVEKLRANGHDVAGAVCHVGKQEDRDSLFKVKGSERFNERGLLGCRRLSAGGEVWTFWSPMLQSILTSVGSSSTNQTAS